MAQEVQELREAQVSVVRASGGRHATNERYRGRHRKPRPRGRRQGVIRLGITAAVAALLVCLPQPSWADRSGHVTIRSAAKSQISAGASQVSVPSLPNPFRQQHQ